MRKSTRNIKTQSDEDLMKMLQKNGDHEVLSELYHRYAQRLLGYFIKMFKGDVPKSQDFLHDLFYKIMDKKDQFNTEKKFYSWIFTIASNMCKTSFRQNPNISIEKVSDHELFIEEVNLHDQNFTAEILKQKIYELSDSHRIVFTLKYIEGFSLKETAEITETSLGTVKSRLYYATKKLAEELDAYKPDYITKNKGHG